MSLILEEYTDNETVEKIEKQMITELGNLCDNTRECISRITVLNYALLNAEHEYNIQKNHYEHRFNTLCMSEDYIKKYKAMNAREKQVSIDLHEMKQKQLKMETTIKVYKAELEHYRNILKLLLIYEGEHHE